MRAVAGAARRARWWRVAPVRACRPLLRRGLWAARVAGRWLRRGLVVTWRALRPYGTASWRHPPRGA